MAPGSKSFRAFPFRRKRNLLVGAGLVATTRIRKGTTIYSWAGCAVLPRPTYQSVQIGRKAHAHDPRCLNLLNHNCDPNVRIDIARRTVVASREISPGELLTCFYPGTEWDMARPFRCRCRSTDCIGWVRGAKHLSPARLKGHPLSRHVRGMKRDQKQASLLGRGSNGENPG